MTDTPRRDDQSPPGSGDTAQSTVLIFGPPDSDHASPYRCVKLKTERASVPNRDVSVDVDGDDQRTVAVWVFYLLSFLAAGSFLSLRARITPAFVGTYWFPALVLTGVGVIPPPWKPLVD